MVLQDIVQSLAAILLSADFHLGEAPVLVHGHAAVVEQIAVVYLVKAALGIQKTHMALKLLAFHKSLLQPLHDLFLLLGQCQRIGGVYRREVHVPHDIVPWLPRGGIDHANRPCHVINPVQQHPVLHVEFRMAHDQLALQLKLNHGYGLVHFGIQT